MVKARTAALRGTARVGVWVAAACLLSGGPALAAPTVAQMLSFRPRQDGVPHSTPSADKQAGCKVELVKGQGRGSGWVLKDEDGNLLRKFFDTNDDNHIDVWSYYKDGVEVYSEVDTTFTGKPDQFRWLNAGGMKWGVDENKDGKIDSWKAISPEEVSQELLQALINRDTARFQALLLTDAEVRALSLPGPQAERVREQLKGAADKFQEAAAKLTKLSPKTTWLHLETGAPQCIPADATAGSADVIKHARGTVLFDVGGGNDWLQTGEMYQVSANAWRLAGGPTPGAAPPASETPGTIDNPEVQKLVEELTALDKSAPASEPGPSEAVARHHLARADVLEKIVGKVKAQEREPWIRQVADSLSTAAQASAKGETTALDRLRSLEAQLGRYMPGHNLTAYVTYREMQADYSAKIAGGDSKNFNKVQQEWLERLGKFVQTYPRAEDTPDVLLQAGMVAEFLSKEVEAKNWYGQLKRNFPDKPQAAKAAGAARRLDLEGQRLHLAAPTLADSNVAFDLDQVAGKVVVVYYWASWNSQCTGDFSKLKYLADNYGSKGLELVCVNLDTSVDEARKFLRNTPAPGTHLYQSGGLEGKLATDYGIMVLPNAFLVGKDGKVVNRNAQIANLEDEVKKLLK
jgi:thiol-disulfide isomerase/thioredoxin